MASYLEIAMRAITSAQPGPSEPTPSVDTSTQKVMNQSEFSPVDVVAIPEKKSNELAPCGLPYCAGCYDVGDGRRIHPPKIGEEYRKWLERWKPDGRVQ
jgi:hypothetical protein